MALPKLNDTIKFDITIPSTKETKKFRPYLVKEEKILMVAFESKDPKQGLSAITDTIQACCDEEIDVKKLAMFDVEYLFMQLRMKSVGETSDIHLKCKKCENVQKFTINLEDIKCEVPDERNIINLTNDVSIEMIYPSYTMISESNTIEKGTLNANEALALMAKSIKAVHAKDERIDMENESAEEIDEFVNSLTSGQLSSIMKFFEDMPAIKHDISYNCEKCEEENGIVLRGIADFF